ncbi:MAG: tryptophan synthase subunit alpha [Halieaceae bacterium]|jgi:tryptophan synthase alpha chain|nr:tryptophan synthase subunit alpha [Halieaceae bacterium]
MSRIAARFAALRAEGRKAVLPYIVAGDPAADITVDLMAALVEAGADLIELGVPFSDPMSEGPVIQRGHERALDRGIRLRHAIEIVREFRQRDADTPVLLMGYANPVERMGYARFADEASAAGVDALLTVDIPPEEVATVRAELDRVGMDNIFLVAPTTPEERRRRIASEASGFIYYVSLKGVTGAGNLDQVEVATQVDLLRQYGDLPVCVGFGIKDGASAAAVARSADGVVVGSALVQRLADVVAGGGDRSAVLSAARELLSEIRRSVDAVPDEAAA